MKTYFAPAERLTREMLQRDIDSAVANPAIDGLSHTVSGLVAVLNGHRQILAVNDAFLAVLGIDDADLALEGFVREKPSAAFTTMPMTAAAARPGIVQPAVPPSPSYRAWPETRPWSGPAPSKSRPAVSEAICFSGFEPAP